MIGRLFSEIFGPMVRRAPMVRLLKVRTTTEVWRSAYAWHFGAAIPCLGPIQGVDHLTGGAPFGWDPFLWRAEGVVQNPNAVIAGAPANGKSALVKQAIWEWVGAFGYRWVGTDVKGEYRALADALGLPVLELRPHGDTRINPLDDEEGRLEFTLALASLCLDRSLDPIEKATVTFALRMLPERPLIEDLYGMLRDMPAELCNALQLSQREALSETRDLRYGLGEILTGAHAGMFNGRTNVDLTGSRRGFVVDISKCGSDDRTLRFALLAGMRSTDQLLARETVPTVQTNDEGWRLGTNMDSVRFLQHSFKLGRHKALANVLVLHRFAEIGQQADGAVASIANRLISDADTHISFRQGDRDDAVETVQRFGWPEPMVEVLTNLDPYKCLVHARGKFALVSTKLTPMMRTITDTNAAMRSAPVAADA